MADSEAITIVLDRIFHLDRINSIPDTVIKILLQSVGPGIRLRIIKGSATRAESAVVGYVSNWYILKRVLVVVS